MDEITPMCECPDCGEKFSAPSGILRHATAEHPALHPGMEPVATATAYAVRWEKPDNGWEPDFDPS